MLRVEVRVKPDVTAGTTVPVTVHCRSAADETVRDAAGVRVRVVADEV